MNETEIEAQLDREWQQIRAQALAAAVALQPTSTPESAVELAGRLALWIREGGELERPGPEFRRGR